jgi:hypothetical protein
VANYLQRVIASGALTSVTVRPPVSSVPVVPLARPPLAHPGSGLGLGLSRGLGQEPWAPEFAPSESAEPALRPAKPFQPIETSRKPDVVAAPQRADAAAEGVNQPVTDEAHAERLEKPVENAPAAAPSRAANPPIAPSGDRPGGLSHVKLPSIAYLPGIARGPRIQAPKGLRPLSGQPRAGDRSGGPIKEESGSPLVVERTVAQVREGRPGETPAAQPGAGAAARVGPMATVASNVAEPGISRSNPTRPPIPNAPREPVRAATPAPVQTVAQPQPAREAAARPIAAVARPQSRINIGRIDVRVNNRPAAAPQASQPARAVGGVAPLSALEALGMDRFTIKP